MKCNDLVGSWPASLILINGDDGGFDLKPSTFQVAKHRKTCRDSILWINTHTSRQPHAGDGSLKVKAKPARQLIFLPHALKFSLFWQKDRKPQMENTTTALCINNSLFLGSMIPLIRTSLFFCFSGITEMLIYMGLCSPFAGTLTDQLWT